MEALGVRARWMAECANVARQQEVERLELLAVRFAVIERGQRPHHRWAVDRHSADRRAMLER
jgi:hypothetical protein